MLRSILARRCRTAPVRAALLALACLMPTAVLPAQPSRLTAGDRVRVHAHGATTAYVARVVRVGPDTLWLSPRSSDGGPYDTPRGVALASMRRLQLADGRERHVQRDAMRGAIAGAGLGALAGLAITETGVPRGEVATFMAATFAVPGAILGALNGLRGTDRWVDVALWPRLGTTP